MVSWFERVYRKPARASQSLGSLASTLAIGFGITLVLMHVLEPEHNIDPVSLYSLGSFGFVLRIGFLLLATAFFSLTLGLWSEARNTHQYYPDLVMFFVSGLGLVLIGLFNTDPAGTNSPTTGGLIHAFAATTWSLACSIGIILFAVGRLDVERFNVARWSRNLGVILLILWFAGFLGQLPIVSASQPRIFYSLVVVWMLIVANQVHVGGLKVAP